MSGVTKIEIQESREELEQLLREQKNLKLKERLQVLYLLSLPQNLSISSIATSLGKHRSTLQRWLALYQEKGLNALLEIKKSPGRRQVIPNWAVEQLRRRLEQPQGFKSYGEVQQW